MKDFIDTIKDFPDILKHAFRVFKDSYQQSKGMYLGYLFLFLVMTFIPYVRNFIQGLLLNRLQESLVFNYQLKLLLTVFIGIIIIPSFLQIISNFFQKLNYFKIIRFYENELTKKSIEIDPQLHEDKLFNNLKNRISSKGVYTVSNFETYFLRFLADFLVIILNAITVYHYTKIGFFILLITLHFQY